VSSVPYWDERCGVKFTDIAGFEAGWDKFWAECTAGEFHPRGYILDNLTLEQRALQYYEIARSIMRPPAMSQTSDTPADEALEGASQDRKLHRRHRMS
jgi:hypothetical protein